MTLDENIKDVLITIIQYIIEFDVCVIDGPNDLVEAPLMNARICLVVVFVCQGVDIKIKFNRLSSYIGLEFKSMNHIIHLENDVFEDLSSLFRYDNQHFA